MRSSSSSLNRRSLERASRVAGIRQVDAASDRASASVRFGFLASESRTAGWESNLRISRSFGPARAASEIRWGSRMASSAFLISGGGELGFKWSNGPAAGVCRSLERSASSPARDASSSSMNSMAMRSPAWGSISARMILPTRRTSRFPLGAATVSSTLSSAGMGRGPTKSRPVRLIFSASQSIAPLPTPMATRTPVRNLFAVRWTPSELPLIRVLHRERFRALVPGTSM
jgi:hypothetical protein